MFVRISRGDRLPTVALAQARLVMDGANLDVDGAFGPRTEDAVIEFQRRHHLAETGNVDPGTWHVLGAARELVAVDHIDAADLAVLAEDRPHLDDGHSNIHVLSASETRGVRVAIESIVARHGARSVSLLRFHGHGGPGHMVVASGRYGDYPNTFAGEYFRAPTAATLELFARLGSIMKPYGSIELHGCRVAARANGRRLLNGMASACGVPVSAGMRSQFGGTAAARFEGPTLTGCPGGQRLADWARGVVGTCRW
jgi:peptidoglycan hydrolase-like protein with peptidoglycan-binding domain